MTRFLVFFALAASLAGCIDGANPFDEETTVPTSTTTTPAATTPTATETPVSGTGAPITSNRTTLPGTISPSPTDAIFRREAKSTNEGTNGNGYTEGVSYNGTDDTFTVDNIAFDSQGPYTVVRDTAGNRLGIDAFSVFANEATVADSHTMGSINQLNYRALYGAAPDGNSFLAIVRTGAYVRYGFGEYIFQRNNGVTLPTSEQALHTGTNNYGGLSDFSGRGSLKYVSEDIDVRIDFNEGSGP